MSFYLTYLSPSRDVGAARFFPVLRCFFSAVRVAFGWEVPGFIVPFLVYISWKARAVRQRKFLLVVSLSTAKYPAGFSQRKAEVLFLLAKGKKSLVQGRLISKTQLHISLHSQLPRKTNANDYSRAQSWCDLQFLFTCNKLQHWEGQSPAFFAAAHLPG